MMSKLTAAYHRMNQRERLLTLGVAAVLFVLVNFFVWSWLFASLGLARRDLATRRATRSEQAVYMKERGLWEKRKEWLEKTQPALKDAAEASTLLDQLKQIASKYDVLIENPAIGSGETAPTHQAVFASIETKSDWPNLIHFLYDVQQPDSFVVFESVNIAVDGNDATTMRGKFKIARWFAPANRKKS
jgi:hypothetical protein